MKKTYLLTLLLCFNSLVFAQVCGQLDTTFNAIDNGSPGGFNGPVYSMAVQPDGNTLIGGSFLSYYGISANHIIRLNTDGSIDNTFASGMGFNAAVTAISVQIDGKILLGGTFNSYNGTTANNIIRLNTDGSIDNTFANGTGFNYFVSEISVQTDGKILVGGYFYSYNGTSANRIIRLNTDGSIDNTFASGTGFNDDVDAISVQTNGKILVGGDFTSYNGTSVNRIIRLNTDGSIDNTFTIGTGFNDYVSEITIQTNGKILVGGNFYSYNGTAASEFIRLNIDGSVDNTFSMGSGFYNEVRVISVQTDGKILVGGWFTSFNGTSANRIIRLNANGSIDNTFAIGTGFNAPVVAISVQTDGKILAGGQFTSYNGTSANYIIRLNTDGSIDNTFASGMGFDGTVIAISVQTDGKILAGGGFNSCNGTSANNIIRLNTDGSIDNTFISGTGFDGAVNAISVQTDGKILVGGYFSGYNGISANNIIRLNTNGSIDNSFIIGTAFDYFVNSISIQTDGKILLGGGFSSYNGTSANNIIRLNTDGSIDNSFTTGTGFDFDVNAISVQLDGNILVGGIFTNYNGTSESRIIRLLSDGSSDNTFTSGTGFDGDANAISVQTDGKILVGGDFSSYNGTSANRIIRLNTDGSIDNNFASGTGFNDDVNAISVQTDGKFIVGGRFTNYNGTSANNIIRLNTNGSIDNTFANGAGFDDWVRAISFQPDGKLLVGGYFSNYNGNVKHRLCRLHNATIQTTPLINAILCLGATVSVSYTTQGQFGLNNIFTLELSDPFGSFSNPTIIGSLQAVAAGTINAFIPSGTTQSWSYRLRVVSSNPAAIGIDNGSDLIVELGEATINYFGEPFTCTGGTVVLQANTGNGLTYQWQLNNGNITGQTNATYAANAGGSYTVVVTNAGLCSTVSAPLVINPIPTPTPICVCTVDSSSTYNLIVWEKPITTSIDSFRVYREDISNAYTYVASVDYDSLSQYTDTDIANADPNTITKRYKLKTVSICGDTSTFSHYHGTILLNDQGNGTFDWNFYDIQNVTTPISQYILYRDTTLNNSWYQIQTATGTQTFMVVPNYLAYPSCRYKIESDFSFTCEPTRAINVTQSNIINHGNILTRELSLKSTNDIQLFPNPAQQSVTIICKDESLQQIQLRDVRGNIIATISAQQYQSSKGIIDLNAFANGVYFVQVMSNHKVETRKLVVQ